MKRFLKIVGLVLVLILVAAAVLLGPVFLGRRPIPDNADVSGVRVVKDGFVTVGVFPAGPREVALIDAGNDRTGTAILAELARRGLGPDAVTTIFITHGHPDHLAGTSVFPKAQVMALEAEVPLVEGRAKAGGPLPRLMPPASTGVHVTRALTDGEVVSVGPVRVQVFAVPGHTAGSAAYLVDDVLFLGDAVDLGRDGSVRDPAWIFSDDRAESRASVSALVRRLADGSPEAHPVKALVFAHSGAVVGGLAPLTTYAR